MKIRQRGFITRVLKGNKFEVALQDNEQHKAITTPCDKMQKRRIILCLGDEVDIELSEYDLTRGRIVWRY